MNPLRIITIIVVMAGMGAVFYWLGASGSHAQKPGSSSLPTHVVGGAAIPTAQEDNAVSTCPISGPRGAWDMYQTRDLPRGHCSGAQACTLWTKDSCPGTDYPGPGIKWKCMCNSGIWHCDELERTKTACVVSH